MAASLPSSERCLRQRSCLNMPPFLPCVHKAISHLQKIQQSLFSRPRTSNEFAIDEQFAATSPIRAQTTEDLEVTGRAVSKPNRDVDVDTTETLEETSLLIARLDDDCRETVDLWKQETKRLGELREKLEELLEKRLAELPAAVQEEHEACAMDIAELQWHVAYRSRALNRQNALARVAVKKNQEMKDGVDHMKKHCPQVEAKLALVKEEMSQLSKEHREVLDKLHQTKYKLLEMDEKRAQAYGRIEQQRSVMGLELNGIKENLQEVDNDHDRVIAKRNALTKTINENLAKLSEDERTHQMLDEKYRLCKKAGCQAEDNVAHLKRLLLELRAEQAKVNAKNDDLINAMEEEKGVLDKEIDGYQGKVKEVKSKLKKTREKNTQLEDDVANMMQEIILCEERAVKDDKTVKRADRDRLTLDEQLKVSLEEARSVQKEYHIWWTDVRELEEETSHQRNSLQITLDTLKEQLMEEIQSKTTLEAKIKHDNTDMAEFQADSTRKMQKSSQKARQLEEQNSLISAEVDQMKSDLEAREKTIKDLKRSLLEVDTKHETDQRSLESRRAESADKNERLEVETEKSEKESRDVDWRNEKLEKKLDDLLGSVKVVKKLEGEATTAIEELRERYEKTMGLLKAGREEEKQLRDELKEIEDYHSDVTEKHAAYMAERMATLAKLKADAEKELSENSDLAERYWKEQALHMKAKGQLMETMDRRLELESSIRDHKQLMNLQLQMHLALEEYYILRGMVNEQCYSDCCRRSSVNGQHLESVEIRFRRALEEIGKFLLGNETQTKELPDFSKRHLPSQRDIVAAATS